MVHFKLKIYTYAPYCYVGSDPVNKFDPNGMDWADANDEELARGILTYLESRESELTKDINKYNNDITKAKNKSYKNEAEKTAAISKIEKNRNESVRMRQDVQDSQREIAEMGGTKEMTFTFRDLGLIAERVFFQLKRIKSLV